MKPMHTQARLALPLVAMLGIAIHSWTPFLDPIGVALLTLVLLCLLGVLADHGTTPMATRVRFHAETLVRAALVAYAVFLAQDTKHIAVLCIGALAAMQFLVQSTMELSPRSMKLKEPTLRFSVQDVLGLVCLLEAAWGVLYFLQYTDGLSQMAMPAPPTWAIALALVATLVFARENVWTSLASSRRLSMEQRETLWPRLVQKNIPRQYWIIVHDYFSAFNVPSRPWTMAEIHAAVNAAPMPYLMAYLLEQYPLNPPPYYLNNRLNTALLEAVKLRTEQLDKMSTVAWSLAQSPQEAAKMIESRMPAVSDETLELPAL